MPHELKGFHQQPHEYFTQLLLADLALLIFVIALAYYLHLKQAKPTAPPRTKGRSPGMRRKWRR